MAERPEVRGLPRFILGQSMGGAITLKVHLKDPYGWDGVILVAPMCKVSLNHLLALLSCIFLLVMIICIGFGNNSLLNTCLGIGVHRFVIGFLIIILLPVCPLVWSNGHVSLTWKAICRIG